jgi:hypothetical protein
MPTRAAGRQRQLVGHSSATRQVYRDLRPHGWQPGRTLHIPAWCGGTTEYVPVPVNAGSWQLVPIWDPDQTMNPLRRFAPPEPR